MGLETPSSFPFFLHYHHSCSCAGLCETLRTLLVALLLVSLAVTEVPGDSGNDMRKEVCVNFPDGCRSQVELGKNVCFKRIQIRDLCSLCMLWDAVGCT